MQRDHLADGLHPCTWAHVSRIWPLENTSPVFGFNCRFSCYLVPALISVPAPLSEAQASEIFTESERQTRRYFVFAEVHELGQQVEVALSQLARGCRILIVHQ